ncbi:glycosyl hydrolase family 28-related protein [Kineosporia sp. A_224]|uniref:glycosyl hydrolase family 28-related protein n=1 Tax=Kineosporia sp. A_224 TaxID=1962180 RepID=UPI0018E99A2E|nr:glycosyl hydrolase family 28-related protein [Kineosporia sp. A_224]
MGPTRPPSTARPRRTVGALALAAALVVPGVALATGVAPASAATGDPDLGPNVAVFDPSMATSAIQAKIDEIAAKQIDNEMGSDRYALLFKPGTYGTAAAPLNVKVGYYTEVAGLGLNPTDVTINGHVDVVNRCFPTPTGGQSCIALNNFWRSLSNLTIDVKAIGQDGCRDSATFWAVSQAAPMRRVNVTGGNLSLMDYCSGPSFASGGFISDSKASFVISGSQQQWYTRDSTVGGWSNGVWNQVFSGVNGAPATCFPADAATCGGPYTTLAKTPVSKEKPYLYVDAAGSWNVFVPAVRRDSSGTTWENGPTPGTSVPLSRFFVAKPSTSVRTINEQLDRGKHLLLTPGVYDVARTIEVERANTVVLGLGLPSLSAQRGALVLDVADARGIDIAGVMVDAGPVNSKLLIRIGSRDDKVRRSGTPVALQDVFVRIGGPQVGKATVTMEVNSDDALLDNLWLWRADHGNPGTVGWTVNTADTGLVVNGDDVTATGLFVEHYQKTEVIWNGERGNVVFFQNELPYDPPSQAAWSRPGGVKGYPALKVSNRVKAFTMTGAGSYSFFNQGLDIFADNAFEVPKTLPKGSLTNLLTIFLDPANGKGGIENVVNGVGGSSTIANPDVPVTVVSYP